MKHKRHVEHEKLKAKKLEVKGKEKGRIDKAVAHEVEIKSREVEVAKERAQKQVQDAQKKAQEQIESKQKELAQQVEKVEKVE